MENSGSFWIPFFISAAIITCIAIIHAMVVGSLQQDLNVVKPCPKPSCECSCPTYEAPDCRNQVISEIKNFADFQDNLNEVLNQSDN